MYGVGGERWLPELLLPWLKGYANSSPVRIGNAASDQMQIDVFGELADAMFQAYKAGMEPVERGRALRPLILEYLAEAWRQPDEGIWEVRGGPQHFVHSKVMAWVAFDRAAHDLEVQTGSDKMKKSWARFVWPSSKVPCTSTWQSLPRGMRATASSCRA